MPDHSKTAEQNRAVAPVDEVREQWPEESQEPSRRERTGSYLREHPVARLVLIVLLLAVVGGSFYLWRYFAVRESTDDAQIDGHIVPISSRVVGTVISVHVEDNQYVERGTVLVQLDPKDYEVAVQKAKADLATAQAAATAARTGVPIASTTTSSGISTAQAGLNAAQKQVDAAKARVREAQANFNRVSADLKRAQQLVAKDEISQQQYDAAYAAEQGAHATLDAAHAAQASAESQVAQAQAAVRSAATGPQQVAVTRSRAAEADAAVLRAQASLQQAELNLAYTTIKAPYSGIISKRSVEPGQVITAGQPLYALVDLENIYTTANFKETQLAKMCPGQSATIHVDAYGREFKGYVDSLSGATGARFSLLPPENATGNYVKVVQRVPVKIVFEKGQDVQHMLRPGLSVVPTVMTNQSCKGTFNAGGAAPQPSSVSGAKAAPAGGKE